MANTVELWRGAVEPAGIAPSGNQIKAWKGAVEPNQLVNILVLWKGAIEPAATDPSGNEVRSWKGAIEPFGIAEVVTPPVSVNISGRGHISRKPHVVFVDQEEEIEEQEIPTKRMLRITPEVERILNKYKKKSPSSSADGLLGKRKGLL